MHDLVGRVNSCVIQPIEMRKIEFFKFTNLNLNLQKLQSAITRPKLANFAIPKLMVTGKPTFLNKMVSFKKRNKKFLFFSIFFKPKSNIVYVKLEKNISFKWHENVCSY